MPKKTAPTPPTPTPLPFGDTPSWAEAILAEVRSGTERLKTTFETLLTRHGDSAVLTEILQRLEAVASASRVVATASEIAALRGDVRTLSGELHTLVTDLRRVADQTLTFAQSADKYAAEVERRTRPVEAPEATEVATPAPRLGIIGFLRALGRPEVQVGMGRLIQAAERLGQNAPALPAAHAPLSLPERAD